MFDLPFKNFHFIEKNGKLILLYFSIMVHVNFLEESIKVLVIDLAIIAHDESVQEGFGFWAI